VALLNWLRLPVIALAAFAANAVPADAASPTAAQASITQRLHQWTIAFNNRDVAHVCDIFSTSVIATVPDAPQRRWAQVCDNLFGVLSKSDRRLHYASTIHEIIVSGNYAIVRLDWTLRVTQNGRTSSALEHGMDLFEKDRSGTWSIVRFLAFTDASGATDP
jgi:ketosteroid isomerase-like protein